VHLLFREFMETPMVYGWIVITNGA